MSYGDDELTDPSLINPAFHEEECEDTEDLCVDEDGVVLCASCSTIVGKVNIKAIGAIDDDVIRIAIQAGKDSRDAARR